MYVAIQAVLSLYASGRTTGIVMRVRRRRRGLLASVRLHLGGGSEIVPPWRRAGKHSNILRQGELRTRTAVYVSSWSKTTPLRLLLFLRILEAELLLLVGNQEGDDEDEEDDEEGDHHGYH